MSREEEREMNSRVGGRKDGRREKIVPYVLQHESQGGCSGDVNLGDKKKTGERRTRQEREEQDSGSQPAYLA